MASSQDVISFRLSYAEFKGLTDPDIAAALDDADVWLDSAQWSPRDFPTARALWAAHNLAILAVLRAQQQAMGDLMGFTDQTLSSVSFGERRVAFGRLVTQRTGQASRATPGAEFLQETTYGQLFAMLRARNIMPILII